MKKALIYISAALALLAVSCSRAEMEVPGAAEWGGEGSALRLGVKSADIVRTKADATRPGDDDGSYNENKILTLDYFIYPVDPSAEGNTSVPAITQGRISYAEGIEPTTEQLAKDNAKVVDLKEFEEYFGEGKANKCYVYVIANLPEDFTMGENGLVYTNADETTTEIGTTWTDLQAVEVVADFKGSVDEDGRFKAQDSFVMTGLSDEVTVSGTGPDSVIVELSRLASKVTLDINVIKLIDKYTYNTLLSDFSYDGTYFPNVEKMQIYLTYADASAVISGEADSYDNTFFTYNRYAFQTTEVDEDGAFAAQVIAREEDGSIKVDAEGNPTYTTGTEYPAFGVKGTPFYSYPIEWASSDTHAPFIKIIIPWVHYNVDKNIRDEYTDIDNGAGTITYKTDNETYQALIEKLADLPETETLIVEGTEYPITRKTSQVMMNTRYGDEFYYKISIPALKEGSKSEFELVANNWYNIKLDISVLGSETDDASVIISGSTMGIYVCNWSAPNDNLGGDLDNGRYLSTVKSVYTINSENSLTIPVISSHALSITGFGGTGSPTATFWKNGDAATAESGSLTYSTSSSTGNNFQITPNGTSYVTLAHTLLPFSTSFTTANAKDVAKITYKFRIRHADNANYYKDITVIQYPSVYVEVIQSYSNTVFLNSKKYSDRPTVTNNNGFALGTLGQGQVSGQTLTVIAVSSLAGMLSTYPDWVIGDPTVKLSDNLPYSPYDINEKWLWNDLGDLDNNYIENYWYAGTDRSNFIAPKIIMASGFGANTGRGSWKTNAERCAAYQEAGYPAGRWRLPTEAEILFGYTLGNRGLIPQPFQSSGYWANSGRYFDGSFHNGSSSESRSVRCVYDLWYWGDDPIATGTDAQSWLYFHADAKN